MMYYVQLTTVSKSTPDLLCEGLLCITFLTILGAQGVSDAVMYVDSSQQVIRGFGGTHVRPKRPDLRATEVQKAFGTGSGQIGLSMLRLHIPLFANEFSPHVQTALAAHAMGLTIIASPWTPLPLMLTNNNIVGGTLLDTLYHEYADLLKSFVDYMVASGIPLYGVSVQNEPDIPVTYESCNWSASDMVRFMID